MRSLPLACALAFCSLAAVVVHADAPTPTKPTQSLGVFITPVDATASSSQKAAGRTPRKLIDGSGWGETAPGSGVYVHTSDVGRDGNCMWNGDANATLGFDLGKTYRVNGVYVWNYNEGGGWNSRSVKGVAVSSSENGKQYAPLGQSTFAEALGTEADPGQAVPFPSPVRARYFRFQILSNYRGGEMSGLAAVRFSNADAKAIRTTPTIWKPPYPRPTHPHLALGQPLPDAENVAYPADAGVVDVTKAPYFAKGDGRADETAAIQKALDDHPSQGAIICPMGFIALWTPCTGRTATAPDRKKRKPSCKDRAARGRSARSERRWDASRDAGGGGRTELLGGLSYTVGAHLPDPMFVVDNAQATLSFSEACYTGQPFDTVVRETHGIQTREMKKTAPEWGSHFTLFTSVGLPAP